MSRDASYRVIRPDGVRSKPTTAERIIEMYKAGNVTEDSVIRQEGSDLELPVGVFADIHSVGTPRSRRHKPTTFVPSTSKGEMFPEPAEYVPQQPSQPFERRRSSWRPDDESLNLAGRLWHFLSFRGMEMPRDDRGATAEYLSRQITWLERSIKVLHFYNILNVWLIAFAVIIGTSAVLFGALVLIKERGVAGGIEILLLSTVGYLYIGIVFMAYFFVLMVVEALLRLVPASLRYWMAITNTKDVPQK